MAQDSGVAHDPVPTGDTPEAIWGSHCCESESEPSDDATGTTDRGLLAPESGEQAAEATPDWGLQPPEPGEEATEMTPDWGL